MKSIFFLIFLGPFLFSQNYQAKDSLKILAQSNFKSVEVFENKNGNLLLTKKYSYDSSKNKITIENTAEKNKEWLKTIIRLDKDFNIQEEERITEGMVISEKENKLIKKQVSMLKKYFYRNNIIEIKNYNSTGNLSIKEFKILDKENRIIENISLFKTTDDIVVSEIEKYNWIDDESYNYEKVTFSFPRVKIIGMYKLNQYGEVQSFKGSMTTNDKTELYDYDLGKRLKKFDSKGNLIKIYTIDNGRENIIEERRIVY